MQDIHVELNPDLSQQKRNSTRKTLFSSNLESDFRKKVVKCYILEHNLDTSENRSEILGSFENRSWRRMLKILWTHCVKNENILHITDKESDVLHTNKPKKAK